MNQSVSPADTDTSSRSQAVRSGRLIVAFPFGEAMVLMVIICPRTIRRSSGEDKGIQPKPVMKFRHLEYFVAAAEELNFTHAADRLHVSQPPFSKQIHDLEGELGIELFERRRKGVALTPAGSRSWSTPGGFWKIAKPRSEKPNGSAAAKLGNWPSVTCRR
jgi:hypothetical protein